MAHDSIDYPSIEERILRAISSAADTQAAMELIVAELKDLLPHYDWVGIYLLHGDSLDLGPYRGEPSPHTQIPLNQGICGAAASTKQTVIVPDVNADPRYLACSIKTKSEIVVPLMHGARCFGEIDIDSYTPEAFTGQDWAMLESVATELARKINEEPSPTDLIN